ncbi:MAG TPA: hypothetical protein VK304_13810 [Thermoleophilaceae bacterium]|nr:hypothetical protein [Thermoleophilaceae bacterium]
MSETIACSLTAGGQLARRREAAALIGRSLIAREPIEGGLRLRFRGDCEAELRELLRRERECCPFFGFSLFADGSAVVLDATAPPDARGLLEELFAAP